MPSLKIGGQEFTGKPALGARSTVKFSEEMGAAQGGSEASVLFRFARNQIASAEQERFDRWWDECGDDVSIQELNEAIGDWMTEYAGRPTGRSSGSPPGSVPAGGPSRVVSLGRATARADGTSSEDGKQAVS